MRKKLYGISVFAIIIVCMFASGAPGYDHPDFVRIPLNGKYMTLEPGVTDDMLSTEIQTQLFLALTRFNYKTLKLLPFLAKRWKASRDLKTYVFYLRKDARWTDGEPVTAHDVVWAIRRNILPETGSKLASFLYVLKNGEKIHKGEITNITKLGVHLIDDHALEFQLEHPAIFFPAMVAYTPFWPLPRKAIAIHGKEWTKPENIITNGPYRLTEIWEDEEETVLEANPDFFDADKVDIPGIHYMTMEPERAMQMYENEEIDIIGGEYMPIPSSARLQILYNPDLEKQFTNKPRLCTYYYGFNNEKPPTDNALVRRAVSAAIDRQVIVDHVTMGNEEPAFTFTRPPIFGSVDPDENIGIRFNPDQARAWLAEAGYPDGENFPGFLLVHSPGKIHEKIALAVQTQLRIHLRISITVKEFSWDQYDEMFEKENDVNMFRYGWCADYPDANNWLMEQMHPTKSANLIRWQNKSFSELVEKAQRTMDEFTRKRLYKKAEKILCQEEAAIAPIYYYTGSTLTKPWLNAKIWPLLGNHIWTWSFNDSP
ncbi:MAG: peptide ABC transporter substrate-binding protein [Desulfobacterales bacterium]|nr:peptide ABC transporter substrate-binding protein [Desulfobacterales bacterium]